jgi:hypothetical protein
MSELDDAPRGEARRGIHGRMRDADGLNMGRGDAECDRDDAGPRIKPNPRLAPITEPPFYAMGIGPGTAACHG